MTSCLCGSQSSRLGSWHHVESGQRGGEAAQLCSAPTALASHGLFPRGGATLWFLSQRPVLPGPGEAAGPLCLHLAGDPGQQLQRWPSRLGRGHGKRLVRALGLPAPRDSPPLTGRLCARLPGPNPVTPFLSSTAQSPVLWALCHRRPGDPNLPAEVRAGGGGFPGTSWRTHCRSGLLQSFGPSCLVPTSPSPDPGPVQRNPTEPQDRHCSEPTESEDETLT